MERNVSFRKPVSSSEGLSKTARTFFGLNIFQVFAIGGIQGAMIIWGDFSPVSEGGLGPGRRIYMALFLGAILYSCLLCLFAVKKENYLEILAFVFQNYGYIVYSGIQVFHISFKKYADRKIRRQKNLVYLTLIDSGGLFVLNIIFTYLAVKLYGEYGWKIYKRVRFNIRLRAAFHLYETVIMLLKMVFLFITMYAICFTQTMFHGQYGSFSFIASMVSIPLSLVWSIFGIMAIRRENRIMAYAYILGVLAAFVYFMFKIVRVATKTCTGCDEFLTQDVNIPGEVELHLLYIATMAVIFLLLLLLASIKAVRNFGIGLKAHFKSSPSSKMTVLNLSMNIFTSIVSSSAVEESQTTPDLESPRPSVSNEPRPSIFQLLPKFGASSFHSDFAQQTKGATLPAQIGKGEKFSKNIRSSAKSRFSQLFWENEIGNLNSSQSGSFTSHKSSSCFKNCCPWMKPRRMSFSTYGIPQTVDSGDKTINITPQLDREDEKSVVIKERQRKRSRSLGIYDSEKPPTFSSKHCVERFNSLPYKDLSKCKPARILENTAVVDFDQEPSKIPSQSAVVEVNDSAPTDECDNNQQQCSADDEVGGRKKDSASGDLIKSCLKNPITHIHQNPRAKNLTGNDRFELNDNSMPLQPIHPPLRRIKSSISSISSIKTESTDFGDSDDELRGSEDDHSPCFMGASRRRKLGVVFESPDSVRKSVIESSDSLRKAASDCDLYANSRQFRNVHFV